MDLDELARASIPVSFLGTNYLSHCLAVWSAHLAPVLPFPTMEFAPPACAQGSITQDIKVAHISPTHSPTLPSWPFASPHPKARREHWPSWLTINVTPLFEITDASKRIFFLQSLTLSALALWILFAWIIFEKNCKWPFHSYLNHTFRWKELKDFSIKNRRKLVRWHSRVLSGLQWSVES